jgi:hypothetical protein
MLAPVKSNLLDGRTRFTISRFIQFRKLRMSSFFGREMSRQRGCTASTISSHSVRAAWYARGRRWLKNSLMAFASSLSSGINRTSRDRTSPMPDSFQLARAVSEMGDIQFRAAAAARVTGNIPGPPKTRITSLEEPPLSEMGMT